MSATSARQGGDGEALAVVWPAAIASGALVATHVAGKATRDTLFLAHFGLALLPAAMIAAALVSSLAVVGFSRALAKYSPARIVPAIFGLAAVLFLLEWWLSLRSERAAAVAVYAHIALFSSASVSAFWSMINERFDPHIAKRIVGRIASGGTLGGVVGGVVVWRASEHLSVPMMLALLSCMQLVGLWGSWKTARGDARQKPGASDEPPTAGGGWTIVRDTPYLRNLALLVLVGAVVQALLDWLLSAHATAVHGKGPRLLAFFALFNTVVGIASFAAQTALTRPLLERLGLAGTAKLQPLGVTVFGLLALLSPQSSLVILLRGVEAVTRNSLFRSAYELFYTPLPTQKKRATKTIIDVGLDRVGTTVGSVALLGLVHFGTPFATRAVLVASIVLATVAWVVATRLHDGYVSALATSLKSGSVALDDDEAHDLTTKKTLAETTALLDREKLLARIEQFQRDKEGRRDDGRPATGVETRPALVVPPAEPSAPLPDVSDDPLLARALALRSGSASRVRSALSSAPLTPALVALAVPLLADDAVVRDTVRALRKVAPKATGQLVDALLDHDVDLRVRRRIPRVLKVCRTQRAASGLLAGLRDPVFEVRVQVALALAEMQDEAQVALARDEVFDLAIHELANGRATWSSVASSPASASTAPPAASSEEALHRGLAHVFTVLGLVLDREPLSIAYRALRSEEASLRGTAHEYLEVVLPARVREVLVPLLGDVKVAPRAHVRGSTELAEELLRSSASMPRPVR